MSILKTHLVGNSNELWFTARADIWDEKNYAAIGIEHMNSHNYALAQANKGLFMDLRLYGSLQKWETKKTKKSNVNEKSATAHVVTFAWRVEQGVRSGIVEKVEDIDFSRTTLHYCSKLFF